MKLFKSTLAVLAIACSPLFAVAGNAGSHWNCKSRPGGGWPIDPAAYVVRNCAFCHSESLQGRAVAPRLAGQHQEYIAIQFERFRKRERNTPYTLMHMAHAVDKILPDNDCELGAYISTLEPQPANNGNEALAAEGEDIFKHGRPEENVPACQFCHGPQGQGVGQFPRLGGQSADYLKRRLNHWSEGFDAATPYMPRIASKLSPGQIEAVASYLSFAQGEK